MKGSIVSLPTGNSTGQIDGHDGVSYEFYLKDFSSEAEAIGLEEMETIEFDPLAGDINRAMHCKRLRATPPVKDVEGEAGQSSDPATPDVEELPPRYLPPNPAPLLAKGQLPAEWAIISISDWCIRGTSTHGADEARHAIAQRTRELGANAVLNLEYGINGAGDQGTKTHFYQGRLAIVGKKDPKGQAPELLAADLNQAAEAALVRQEVKRQSLQKQNYALYGACGLLALGVGGITGLSLIPTLIAAAIALALGIKLSKSTLQEEYLLRIPPETSGTEATK